MNKDTRCITVKDNRAVRISEVVNDCVNDLCVSTYKGESLSSILRKLCALIEQGNGNTNITQVVSIEAGDNITITGTGTEQDPYIISSTATGATTSEPTQFFRFTVGDAGYPGQGYSSYTPTISGQAILKDKYIKVYREGLLEWDGNTTDGITFNPTTGTIGFYPILQTGEEVIVYITDLEPVFPDGINVTTTTTTTTTSTTTTSSTTTTTTAASFTINYQLLEGVTGVEGQLILKNPSNVTVVDRTDSSSGSFSSPTTGTWTVYGYSKAPSMTVTLSVTDLTTSIVWVNTTLTMNTDEFVSGAFQAVAGHIYNISMSVSGTPAGSSSTTTTTTGTTTTTTTSSTTTTTTASTTTTTTAAPTFTAYWGWKDTNTVIAGGSIPGSAQGFGAFALNSTVSADYTSNNLPKYLWMAEPTSQPAKTKWDGDGSGGLNQGDIGGTTGVTSNLFAAPQTTGSFRFYITEYQTQLETLPIEFKIS